MSEQLLENLRVDNGTGGDEARLEVFSRPVIAALLDVVEAAEGMGTWTSCELDEALAHFRLVAGG